MKKIIFVLILAINEMSSSIANAQGTLYFSNLELAPGAAIAFGSDAWKGQGFYTGTNSSVTYALNSIQLRMNATSGNPSGFSVSIYNQAADISFPGDKLVTLTGTAPTTEGVYTYTAPDVTLLPATVYFVVITSLTPVSAGSFQLHLRTVCKTGFQPMAGWGFMNSYRMMEQHG